MKDRNIKFSDTLLDEKSNGNVLIYEILHKNFMCTKPLRIRFDKIDGFIKNL